MSNDLSNRRDKNNKFYATISSAIIVLTSYLINNNYPVNILVLPVLTGMGLCIIWYKHIEDYKLLNKAKFDVINHLENYLPAKGFTIEWALIDHSKYKGLTSWDKKIPLLFLVVLLLGLLGFIIRIT